jgi:recombination protein RecA
MADKKKKEKFPEGMSIDEVIEAVQSKYGTETMMRMEGNVIKNIPVISTGSLVVDKALGVGGLPYGRICEISGQESSGKTTLCLHVIANAQAKGEICAFLDAEHALDLQYAKDLKVNVKDLLLSQPDYGEMTLDILETLLDTKAVKVIVVDSIAALVPLAELEGSMADQQMGLQARMMGKACRKIVGKARKSGTLIIFTNQMREKIGVVFGNPNTTPGGKAMKFTASVRIQISRTGSGKNKDNEEINNQTKIKVIKNKVAPPFKIATTSIKFGEGFDYYGEVVDMAIENGNIKKKGSWFSYDGEQLGQGKEAVIEVLKKQTPSFIEGLLKEPEVETKKKKKKKKNKNNKG